MKYYQHIRNKTKQGQISRTGGKTIALEIIGNMLFVGIAKCSTKDSYCKKFGRTLAAERCRLGAITIPITEFNIKMIFVLSHIFNKPVAYGLTFEDYTIDFLFKYTKIYYA